MYLPVTSRVKASSRSSTHHCIGTLWCSCLAAEAKAEAGGRNPQSAIRNPQSAIDYPAGLTSTSMPISGQITRTKRAMTAISIRLAGTPARKNSPEENCLLS